MKKALPLAPTDLADGEMRSVILDRTTLLIARVEDRHFALDDWCNHAGCLLSGGRLEKDVVVCPCHEVGFDVKSGRVVTHPILCDDQQTFPVEIRDGQLYVDLPDPSGKAG